MRRHAAARRAVRHHLARFVPLASLVLLAAGCSDATSPISRTTPRPNLTVGTTAQTIDFTTTPPPEGSGIITYAPAATASSGLPVQFSAEGACSIANNILTANTQGDCTVTASQPGDETYAAATPVSQFYYIGPENCYGELNGVQQTCTVCQTDNYWGVCVDYASQSLTFTSVAPVDPYVGATYIVAATSSLGRTPVYSSLTTTVCTVAGSTVSMIAAGTCTVAANEPGQYPDIQPAAQITQSFNVLLLWPFSGFLAPISSTKPNSAKAGSAVPVKFTLGSDRGLAIFAAGFPTSAPVTCPAGTTPNGTVDGTSAKSGLSYNALTGVYTYVWETKAAWKGTCRMLSVKFLDNTTHTVVFKF